MVNSLPEVEVHSCISLSSLTPSPVSANTARVKTLKFNKPNKMFNVPHRQL